MKIFVLMENSYDYYKFPHLVKASTKIKELKDFAKKIRPDAPIFLRENITTEMETELSIKETIHFEIVTFEE